MSSQHKIAKGNLVAVIKRDCAKHFVLNSNLQDKRSLQSLAEQLFRSSLYGENAVQREAALAAIKKIASHYIGSAYISDILVSYSKLEVRTLKGVLSFIETKIEEKRVIETALAIFEKRNVGESPYLGRQLYRDFEESVPLLIGIANDYQDRLESLQAAHSALVEINNSYIGRKYIDQLLQKAQVWKAKTNQEFLETIEGNIKDCR